MNSYREDVARIQRLIGNSFSATGALAELVDDSKASKRSKTLEHTVGGFEVAAVELRRLCEQYMQQTSDLGSKAALPYREVTGSVELLDYQWLHIRINTLVPSATYQTPVWFSDTIRRLLDEFERGGRSLPYFKRALMVIDEHSDVTGRRAFDQDNKGYKSISNAVKGRLFPDDDQYTLGLVLLSTRSSENVCHITILDRADAADFFSAYARDNAF